MSELHLRGRVAPDRRSELHDRDQERVAHDPQLGERPQRWRSLLTGPPVVETYRGVDR